MIHAIILIKVPTITHLFILIDQWDKNFISIYTATGSWEYSCLLLYPDNMITKINPEPKVTHPPTRIKILSNPLMPLKMIAILAIRLINARERRNSVNRGFITTGERDKILFQFNILNLHHKNGLKTKLGLMKWLPNQRQSNLICVDQRL